MGQGLGESIQKLGFLPESQNDMIFAIICEELGLFGAIAVIMLFLLMIYRFVMIANDAPDLFGALLVVGVMAHIAIQVILNIAVVTNTIPNTGITLPFIQLWRHIRSVSYGRDGDRAQCIQPDTCSSMSDAANKTQMHKQRIKGIYFCIV